MQVGANPTVQALPKPAPACLGAARLPGARPRAAAKLARCTRTRATGTAAADVAEVAADPVTVTLLNKKLELAVAEEQYAEAARLRDSINSVLAADPRRQLEAALACAVAEQRFEAAVSYRDRLRQLQPSTCSNTVTCGVRVRVKSTYIPQQSSPHRNFFFFKYEIQITNESRVPVKLLARRWVIANADGPTEEVRGPGVVGEKPVMRPGDTYTYTSAVPINTPQGHMEGEYTMVALTPLGDWAESFEINIGRFGLDVNGRGSQRC